MSFTTLARTTLAALCVALTPLVVIGQNPNPIPPSIPLAPDAPFTVAVSTTTIEGGPVYVADNGPMGEGFRVINGGVRNLANGGAHAATNAETQFLAAGTPNVRILFTVAEGLYRVVARHSSGVHTLADLRGQRVVLPPDTSAHYFLVRMLASAGVPESEVTVVNAPRGQLVSAVMKNDADAIAMWEPDSQNAIDALGSDANVFSGEGIYRELFSLYSSTEVLNDPRRRRELVAFVRALLAAVEEMKAKPDPHFPLIAKVTGHPVAQVARSWEHHRFPMAVLPDMIDVMVEEEKWIAARQKREPRSRATLATFYDTSILAEAVRR
jgi:NitT/TauT family transport system substrate-binding protein